ncbi:MAG: SEC-C metal-binding domain-containing protein [Pseudomonadota bacterium]
MTSKRRKGFPSETNVKRGHRFIRGGDKELVEKLGRNDPCPCGSGRSFQEVLPQGRQISMGAIGMIIGGRSPEYRLCRAAFESALLAESP